MKKEKIILPVIALVCLAGVAVGTTYALFTSSKTVNNHINVGNLKAGFYLASITNDEITSTGDIAIDQAKDLSTYAGYEAGRGVDLAVYADDVVAVENFVPTMQGQAKFSVYNLGSIKFNYELKVISKTFTLTDGTNADDQFDDQIELTLTGTALGSLEANSSVSDVVISYKFLDKDNNNDYQLASFSFDVQLVATQVTANHN
ncbi:MAG: SipW-dependent-type signal peptide-containing protein [Bacilli bacterium]|nr:SipW-dependent-type signal peptide-containing protein [Bacilli bacterium]